MGEKHELGDAPIQADLKEVMNGLAAGIDKVINGDVPRGERKNGFILMVFPFGQTDKPRCNYISSAERQDVIILLKEQLARFEGFAEAEGHG